MKVPLLLNYQQTATVNYSILTKFKSANIYRFSAFRFAGMNGTM